LAAAKAGTAGNIAAATLTLVSSVAGSNITSSIVRPGVRLAAVALVVVVVDAFAVVAVAEVITLPPFVAPAAAVTAVAVALDAVVVVEATAGGPTSG
jgi:hypothetical protein